MRFFRPITRPCVLRACVAVRSLCSRAMSVSLPLSKGVAIVGLGRMGRIRAEGVSVTPGLHVSALIDQSDALRYAGTIRAAMENW